MDRVIIEPGIVTGIDGKQYYNPMRIFAESPAQYEERTGLQAVPDDGYTDGGEPYTDEELNIINQ